jgi:filamentous hemagglutinin
MIDKLKSCIAVALQLVIGRTADAVSHEARTGSPVGDRFHALKAQNYSRALQKWLKSNPNASFSDRSAAQSVLKDFQNALKGK